MNETGKAVIPSDDAPGRDDLIAALEGALRSEEPDNLQLRHVLHWARHEPTAARTLSLLSNRSGVMLQLIDIEGHLAHYDTAGIKTRCDAGALLTDDAVTALSGAFECATYGYAGCWPWADGQLPGLVTGDPVSAVRAAYVLCWDLTNIEFDQEPDLHDEDDFDDEPDRDELVTQPGHRRRTGRASG